jgi:hypothetical protein
MTPPHLPLRATEHLASTETASERAPLCDALPKTTKHPAAPPCFVLFRCCISSPTPAAAVALLAPAARVLLPLSILLHPLSTCVGAVVPL